MKFSTLNVFRESILHFFLLCAWEQRATGEVSRTKSTVGPFMYRETIKAVLMETSTGTPPLSFPASNCRGQSLGRKAPRGSEHCQNHWT